MSLVSLQPYIIVAIEPVGFPLKTWGHFSVCAELAPMSGHMLAKQCACLQMHTRFSEEVHL
jgi:hypothetical protein